MGQLTSEAPRPSRSWQDWLGFVGILATAVWTLTGPNWLGIFVAVPVLYDVGMAVTFLVRGRAKRGVKGVVPRIVAYGSSFIVAIFLRVSGHWSPSSIGSTAFPPAVEFAGALLVPVSFVFAFWPLWHMRRSFSIEPTARDLVTSGPYAFARHPIYTIYGINYLGVILFRPSLVLAIVLACWAALTYVRMGYEERVLTEAFPEYASYRKRVGAFGPRFWHRTADPNTAGRGAESR
jgi:protein-S-isoprenylcysteine O-methyltransferase Ste14